MMANVNTSKMYTYTLAKKLAPYHTYIHARVCTYMIYTDRKNTPMRSQLGGIEKGGEGSEREQQRGSIVVVSIIIVINGNTCHGDEQCHE